MKYIQLPGLKNQKGFTLLEVLAALVLLSVGMLGMIKSINSVRQHQKFSQQLTRATFLTSDKLEEVRRFGTNEPGGGAFGFNYIVDSTVTGYLNGFTGTTTSQVSPTETVAGTPNAGYQRILTLNVFPAFAGDPANFNTPADIDMVEAVVRTNWTDDKGQAKHVEMAAVIHRRSF